jgi:hypothetical protein
VWPNGLWNSGCGPWIDQWNLIAGDNWIGKIGEALEASRCCALFIGAPGVKGWHFEEASSALVKRLDDDESFRVIPYSCPQQAEVFEICPFSEEQNSRALHRGVGSKCRPQARGGYSRHAEQPGDRAGAEAQKKGTVTWLY